MCVLFSLSVAEYVGNMESRVKPLLEAKKELSEDEMEKYGKKDLEAYPDMIIYHITSNQSDYMLVCAHVASYYFVSVVTEVQC